MGEVVGGKYMIDEGDEAGRAKSNCNQEKARQGKTRRERDDETEGEAAATAIATCVVVVVDRSMGGLEGWVGVEGGPRNRTKRRPSFEDEGRRTRDEPRRRRRGCAYASARLLVGRTKTDDEGGRVEAC